MQLSNEHGAEFDYVGVPDCRGFAGGSFIALIGLGAKIRRVGECPEASALFFKA